MLMQRFWVGDVVSRFEVQQARCRTILHGTCHTGRYRPYFGHNSGGDGSPRHFCGSILSPDFRSVGHAESSYRIQVTQSASDDPSDELDTKPQPSEIPSDDVDPYPAGAGGGPSHPGSWIEGTSKGLPISRESALSVKTRQSYRQPTDRCQWLRTLDRNAHGDNTER